MKEFLLYSELLLKNSVSLHGHLSVMKFIILLLYIPFVYSELHTLMTAFTGIRSQNLPGPPETFAVTTLDEQQIDYYNNDTGTLVPKQDWMKKVASTNWEEYTKFRKNMQDTFNNNILDLMQPFRQSDGVHTYQRMYGCDWDDETGNQRVFDHYGYDGEDFIKLNIENGIYIASIQQAELTVKKWNNDRKQLESEKNKNDCVFLLKELVHLSNGIIERKESPQVSLLQKNPDYYVLCHVTGFHSRNTTITWRENGQAINDSSKLVKSGKILPNGDGTFQKNVTLYVLPDKWRKDQYVCVVKHKSLAKPIQKILTKEEIIIIKKPASTLQAYIIPTATTVAIAFLAIVIVLFFLICKYQTQIKDGYLKVQTLIVGQPCDLHPVNSNS
ncbi:hypothetical protein QQF64_019830 [Cirrhinus molitorella]|uniref:Ig-like domain-containing protein n=1 Tax=Cirrhinus molitorella TaxID=172907 RepID=A0ABR3LGJ8_9TELE